MTPLRRRMIEDMTLRNFAPHTITAYTRCVARFAGHFHVSPEHLGSEHVRSYLLHLVQERHLAWSSYNQPRCALQFLYRVTLGQDGVVVQLTEGPTDNLIHDLVLNLDAGRYS